MGNLGTKIADESPSGSTRSGKSSHTAHRELHDNLMLTHEHRDPMKYYELIDVLGVGSMGTVAKVKKKDSAVGGSARPSFRKAENRCCYGLPFTCCFAGEGKGKSGLFIAVSEHKLDLLKKSSSLITYGNHKDSYFALKSILLERAADKTFIEELKNEVAILKTLDHPSIVRPLETFSYQNQLYILMELCDGGDLYSRDPYTEMEAARITSSILSAIAYMHSKNITHRDLKYENVMFANKNTDAEVKLIDFGLSAKYGIDETLHGAVVSGTVYSMSPEALRGEYTSMVDVWSVGVLAYMLLSSSMPFYGNTRNHVIQKILKGHYSFKSRVWKYVSDDAKLFVKKCLTFDPNDRPTADEALHLPWMQKEFESLAPELDLMDRVQASMQAFASYGALKKLALMVIAHKSTSDEIGFLRKLFTKYDTLRNGVITLPEFKEALVDYNYSEEELNRIFEGIDVDGTGVVEYSEFLAATIEAHGGISEERLAEAFDRIDCDNTGYITADNLANILGGDVRKSYLESIIDEADIIRDHRVSYEEFMALWDEGEDVKRSQMLEDLKKRRILSHASSAMSAVSSVFSSFHSDRDETTMSDLSDLSGGFLFEQEKAKSVRMFADI